MRGAGEGEEREKKATTATVAACGAFLFCGFRCSSPVERPVHCLQFASGRLERVALSRSKAWRGLGRAKQSGKIRGFHRSKELSLFS